MAAADTFGPRRMAAKLFTGALVGSAVALAGCTATVDGRPVSDGGGVIQPPEVSVFAMNRVLLDAEEIDAAAGTSGLHVVKKVSRAWDDSAVVDNPRCLGVWSPGQAVVYADSDSSVVRGEVLNDSTPPDGPPEHSVVQMVVHFRNSEAAQQFFAQSADSWSSCENALVTATSADGRKQAWTLDGFAKTDDTLTMMQSRQGSSVQCQRALAVHSNVTVDTMMCGSDVTSQAAEIAAAIVDGMPQV